jgi:hypothetical protein
MQSILFSDDGRTEGPETLEIHFILTRLIARERFIPYDFPIILIIFDKLKLS